MATTSFLTEGPLTKAVDVAVGVCIECDYLARLWISREKGSFLFAILNFIVLMTELVLLSQVGRNPGNSRFLDALYFAVTPLTAAGFGDVTRPGRDERTIAIVIMIFGASLSFD